MTRVIFLHRVQYLDGLILRTQDAGVAHLAAHLGVEGGAVEDDLEVFLFLGDHFTEAEDMALAGHVGVADELGGLFRGIDHHPVAVGFLGGFARAVIILKI